MRIRFAFDPFGPFCSWFMAVGAAFSLYCFIVCQAAADPAAWQHHGIYQIRITSLPPNLAALTPTGRSQCTIREKKYQRRPPLLAKDSARSYRVTYSLPDTRCRHAGPDGNRPGCNRAISRRDELAAPIPEIEPFAPWTHSRERFHPRHPAGICSDNRKCPSIWG